MDLPPFVKEMIYFNTIAQGAISTVMLGVGDFKINKII